MNKHVIITGAGRGIGAAIADTFVAHGYSVTLLGRNAALLQDKANALTSIATQPEGKAKEVALALSCDITKPKEIDLAFKQAVDTFGPVDVLVNNAGAALTAPFVKTKPEQFQAMMNVNFLGACYCIQAVLPNMIERNSGRIINIGSTSSVKGYGYVSAYTASKHAIMGLTRSIAIEISKTDVTINTVCPGFTETDIVSDAIDNIIQKTGRSTEQAIAALTKHNPQKRFIQPSEVADQVYYLAAHAPSSITGQAIMVDGGETS
ncbi:MAG: 3-hydroxybutyrate dehydrogenase [Dinoroseobacter sp.]|jgi:3-hydroxybutyrate dehydrogenase